MAKRKRPAAAVLTPVAAPVPALAEDDLVALYRLVVDRYMAAVGEERQLFYRLLNWLGEMVAVRVDPDRMRPDQ